MTVIPEHELPPDPDRVTGAALYLERLTPEAAVRHWHVLEDHYRDVRAVTCLWMAAVEQIDARGGEEKAAELDQARLQARGERLAALEHRLLIEYAMDLEERLAKADARL